MSHSEQTAGQIWPAGCSLPAPGVYPLPTGRSFSGRDPKYGWRVMQSTHYVCRNKRAREWTLLLFPVFYTVIACVLSCFSLVWLFVTLRTVARQAPLSMGFSRQEILGWIALPASRESSQPRDPTSVSYVSSIGRRVLYHWHHLGSLNIFLSWPKTSKNKWSCWVKLNQILYPW